MLYKTGVTYKATKIKTKLSARFGRSLDIQFSIERPFVFSRTYDGDIIL